MKRLILVLLILGLMITPSLAGSVIEGKTYKAGPVITTSVFTGEVSGYTSTYLPQYINRTFIMSAKPTSSLQTTGFVAGTIECSIDGTRWATVDASSLVGIPISGAYDLRPALKMVRIENNPAPYWRIMVAAPTHSSTIRIMTMMSSN